MSALASIRPDSWNFPLLLHVLGAMVLVGAAAIGSISALASGRDEDSGFLRRLAFRSFLIVALPAYIVMRIAPNGCTARSFPDDPGGPHLDRHRLHHGRRGRPRAARDADPVRPGRAPLARTHPRRRRILSSSP
jgi:hypothetical protein